MAKRTVMDGVALAEVEVRRVPEAVGNYFPPAYGPQVAVALAPFGKLPYAQAALLWMLLSALAYFVAATRCGAPAPTCAPTADW